jgi:16S rRNA (adenine1518-N6/adenine1519-N6)-dimethyltransferase
VRPRKRFAQHFLEPAWVMRLMEVLAPQATDVFVEIGPGRGALTRPLASRAAHVTAVEIDRDLAAELGRQLPDNVRLVVGDFLELEPAAWLPADAGLGVRVAGNLPYNITSPIIFRLLAARRDGAPLANAVLMMQQEVADRLVAQPGTKEYGVLGILVGLEAEARQCLALPPGAFRPAPKVHSAVVRLDFRPSPVAPRDPAVLVALVKSIFLHRRKILLNALKPFADARGQAAGDALGAVHLDPIRRPETLSLAELAALADVFVSSKQ